LSKPAEPKSFDQYLDSDLVGMTVIDTSGLVLGEVSEVIHRPAQDLLVVSLNGEQTLVPFVKSIAVEVDVASRRLTLNPPGGLFAN
jgi:16S rRNA processing protein RimM